MFPLVFNLGPSYIVIELRKEQINWKTESLGKYGCTQNSYIKAC